MSAIAEITKVEAPTQSGAGEQVIVDVSVKNISSVNPYNLAVTAEFDSTEIPFQFDYLLVSPGQTVVFRGNFTMPAKNVKVQVWGWYWSGTQWVFDDTVTKDIALSILMPEFSGFGITEYVKS